MYTNQKQSLLNLRPGIKKEQIVEIMNALLIEAMPGLPELSIYQATELLIDMLGLMADTFDTLAFPDFTPDNADSFVKSVSTKYPSLTCVKFGSCERLGTAGIRSGLLGLFFTYQGLLYVAETNVHVDRLVSDKISLREKLDSAVQQDLPCRMDNECSMQPPKMIAIAGPHTHSLHELIFYLRCSLEWNTYSTVSEGLRKTFEAFWKDHTGKVSAFAVTTGMERLRSYYEQSMKIVTW